MRSLFLLALVALLPLALCADLPSTIDASNVDSVWGGPSEVLMKHSFGDFKMMFQKKYASVEEEQERFAIFKENMRQAAELQKMNPEAQYGVTEFSDMHPVEFRTRYMNYKPMNNGIMRRRAAKVATSTVKDLPASFDWRQPNDGRPVAVTPVKNQGQCGSCWAFSAVETLESAWIMAGNKPVQLAEQQVVDCDRRDGGCNGGDTVDAYIYMMEAGLQPESTYPYKARDQTCQYNRDAVVARMKDWFYATPECFDSCLNQDEELLAKNLYEHGPVSICVDANGWQHYQGGIMTATAQCGSHYYSLNHCTQLTGWGVDANGKKFWISRNSWGASWGEGGHIRLAFGTNTCGVADEATLIVV